MRKNHVLLLLLVLLTSAVYAQSTKGDKFPAYILLKDGTRQEGEVKVGTITDNEVKIQFFQNSESKKMIYKPTDLLGYGYEAVEQDDLGFEEKRWIHYETMKVDYPAKPFGSTTVFVEREIEGTVSLFCYYIEVRDNPKQPYRYYYLIKDQEGNVTKVEEENFRKVVMQTFKEYSALTSRLGRNDPLYRNLDRMVRDYNYWTVNQHDSSEYRVAMKE
jgi:hypothetical protein